MRDLLVHRVEPRFHFVEPLVQARRHLGLPFRQRIACFLQPLDNLKDDNDVVFYWCTGKRPFAFGFRGWVELLVSRRWHRRR